MLDEKGATATLPEDQAAQVRQHLRDMLAGAAFRNSPKCSAFLEYVVAATLAGREGTLKERLIGIDVFGRDAEFETSADPIVRVKAGEVRKRLAQYYQGCTIAPDLRIELLPGSYVPVFHWMDRDSVPTAPTVGRARNWPSARRLMLGSCVVILTAAAGGYWSLRSPISHPVDLFWAPLLNNPRPVKVFVGNSSSGVTIAPALKRRIETKEGPLDVAQLAVQPGDLMLWKVAHVAWTDARALMAIGRFCSEHHKAVETQLTTEGFESKGPSPLVFVGLFSNAWTLELMHDLRVTPVITADAQNRVTYSLVDKKDPANLRWHQTHVDPPLGKDYALVARVNDRSTGQSFIVIGGISAIGTQVAAEFATDPERWRRIAETSPPDWATRNIEIVLEMPIIEGAPGIARVVGAYFW